MKKYLKLLKRSKLFYGITEEEIASMLECLSATSQCYQKGEYVFRRGERISAVAMLLEGGIVAQLSRQKSEIFIMN